MHVHGAVTEPGVFTAPQAAPGIGIALLHASPGFERHSDLYAIHAHGSILLTFLALSRTLGGVRPGNLSGQPLATQHARKDNFHLYIFDRVVSPLRAGENRVGAFIHQD
jgi:hypothetical protein